MGKSNSIAKQQKSNEEFNAYIDKMNADMEKNQGAMSDKLESMITEHYKPFSDKSMLMEGAYSHLTTTSEWSLSSVNAIIDQCSQALFGGKNPEGTTEKKDEQASAAIQAMKNRELYIANTAFDIVSSIVGGFSSKMETSVEQKYDAKPIAPGLSLFIGVANNAYSNQSFFSKEKIIQTYFVFKVYYSIKEGQSISKLNDLEVYENQKESFRRAIENINKVVMELDVTQDDYLEQLTKYDDIATVLNSRLQKIGDMITELSPSDGGANLKGAAPDPVLLQCNQIRHEISYRKKIAYKAWKEQ